MGLLSRKKEFWSKFEREILAVIDNAILRFKSHDISIQKEDDLNRSFYFCLVSANFELQKQNRGLESPPFYEGNNQPSIDDSSRISREFKRPDFQWSITDISEKKPEKSPKQFVLECKRIGKPVGSWIINKNYVHHGVQRFVKPSHGYGYGVVSSAMLGYVQKMKAQDILNEINLELKTINQKQIKETKSYSTHIYLIHNLKKSFPLKKIKIYHIWINPKI